MRTKISGGILAVWAMGIGALFGQGGTITAYESFNESAPYPNDFSGVTDARALSTTDLSAMIIHSDGSTSFFNGYPTDPGEGEMQPFSTPVVDVKMTDENALGLHPDGTLSQVFRPEPFSPPPPIPTFALPVAAISTGGLDYYAITTDGRVTNWGDNHGNSKGLSPCKDFAWEFKGSVPL